MGGGGGGRGGVVNREKRGRGMKEKTTRQGLD